MSLSQTVVDGFYLEPGQFNKLPHVVGVVHLAVAVCHCREVEAGHRETEGRGLVSLAVPERFHDEETRLPVHHFPCAVQDADNLFFAEAVEEL